VKEASEVGGPSFIPGDEAPRVLEPGKEALDFPPPFVAPEGATILGDVDPVAAMRGDEFDVIGGEFAVEPVAVVGGIADEPLGIVG
jgi:hypothetical protein